MLVFLRKNVANLSYIYRRPLLLSMYHFLTIFFDLKSNILWAQRSDYELKFNGIFAKTGNVKQLQFICEEGFAYF